MTRCQEFYEKVKKDGNFCGMREDKYNTLLKYIEYREREEKINLKGVLTEGAWIKQQKKLAEVAKHKTERFVGTELPINVV